MLNVRQKDIVQSGHDVHVKDTVMRREEVEVDELSCGPHCPIGLENG